MWHQGRHRLLRLIVFRRLTPPRAPAVASSTDGATRALPLPRVTGGILRLGIRPNAVVRPFMMREVKMQTPQNRAKTTIATAVPLRKWPAVTLVPILTLTSNILQSSLLLLWPIFIPFKQWLQYRQSITATWRRTRFNFTFSVIYCRNALKFGANTI